jgi:hypothetical protein
MTPELDAKLVKKYPEIFAQRFGSVSETAMCWGFDCNDGWYWLIDELCSALQWDIKHNWQPQVVASQVKEKWGGLCFYTHSSTEKQQAMIQMVEYMSERVCEKCGTVQNVKQRNTGWIKTLCDQCANEKAVTYYKATTL